MWKADAVGSYAYYAYDAGMMALAAIEKAGSSEGKALRAALARLAHAVGREIS